MSELWKGELMSVALIGFLVPDERARAYEIACCRNYFADLARVFGVELKLIDPYGVGEAYPETVSDLDTALASFPNHAIVHFAQSGIVHLADLVHPAGDVVYVAGPDEGAEVGEIPGATTVTVATDILWAHHVLSMGMWDRAVKLGTWLSL